MDIDKLRLHGTRFQFPINTTVFTEGDACENFLILTKGTVRVFKTSEDGKEFALYRVSPENLCVLTTTAILGSSTYAASGESESEIEGYAITKEAFDRLIVQDTDFRNNVFGSLSSRITSLIETLDSVVFHNLKDRLLKHLRKNETADGWVHMTHRQLASDLGTEREVISRTLKKLENEGLIETSVSKIRICSSGD